MNVIDAAIDPLAALWSSGLRPRAVLVGFRVRPR